MNHDEAEFGDIPSLPEETRPIFKSICNDIILLNENLDFYFTLFGKDDNFPLFSDTAPAAFRLIQRTVFSDVLLRLGRLLDPAKTGTNINLSLRTLLAFFSYHIDIKDKSKIIFSKVDPIRKWRDKVIAHKDYFYALNPKNNPLPPIRIAEIKSLVFEIGELINLIVQKYINTEMVFNLIQFGDGEHLLFWVKTGFEKLQKERKDVLASIKPK